MAAAEKQNHSPRRTRTEGTCVLHTEELRPANEFDLKMLDTEGRHFEGVQLRGARALAEPDVRRGVDESQVVLAPDRHERVASPAPESGHLLDDAQVDVDTDFDLAPDTIVDPPRWDEGSVTEPSRTPAEEFATEPYARPAVQAGRRFSFRRLWCSFGFWITSAVIVTSAATAAAVLLG